MAGEVTGTNRNDNIGNAGRVDNGNPAGADIQDRADIDAATSDVTPTQVAGEARMLTQNVSNDGFDPANPAVVGTGVAANRVGALNPINGPGLNGVDYTPKVNEQMRLNPRTGLPDNHAFPRVVDNSAANGRNFAFTNADGRIRGGIEVPGSYNGSDGKFQWAVEPNGQSSNHRLFVPEGARDPIARERIIPGTGGAARVAGRALLGVGLAMDGYAIATSDDKPRTAVEKAGAWAGSFAAGGAAAQVAAPLLAGGPVGWVGYGAVVLGAGVAGYVGGEAVASRIYGWFAGN